MFTEINVYDVVTIVTDEGYFQEGVEAVEKDGTVYTSRFKITLAADPDGFKPTFQVVYKDDPEKTGTLKEVWRRTSNGVMSCVYEYVKPVINDIETFAEAFRQYD